MKFQSANQKKQRKLKLKDIQSMEILYNQTYMLFDFHSDKYKQKTWF